MTAAKKQELKQDLYVIQGENAKAQAIITANTAKIVALMAKIDAEPTEG